MINSITWSWEIQVTKGDVDIRIHLNDLDGKNGNMGVRKEQSEKIILKTDVERQLILSQIVPRAKHRWQNQKFP